jgi:hypothetical protein
MVGGRMAGLKMIEALPMEFDSIDWQMLTIEAKRSRSFSPEVYEDAICEPHRLFDDLRPTERVLAARAILALLELAPTRASPSRLAGASPKRG